MSETAIKRRAPAAKLPRGRPCLYTPKIAEEICARLSEGEPLEWICRDEHMPARNTVHLWTNEATRPKIVPPEFLDAFARARWQGEDAIATDCLKIADDGKNDWMERNANDNVGWSLNGEHVQRSKLRIDTRLKLLAKWNPKKYGDKMAVGGADDLPAIKTESDPADVARRVAFLLTSAMRAKKAPKGNP